MNLRYIFDIIRRKAGKLVTRCLPISKDQLKVMWTTYSLFSFRKKKKERRVICLFKTGSEDSTGLADRIKAFVSTYIVAKKNDYRFYVYHEQGFDLQKFLEPNEVDWRIKLEDISLGLNQFKILWYLGHVPKLDTSIYEYHTHRTQDICYAQGASLGPDFTFSKVFHKLFRPSAFLQNEIRKAMEESAITKGRYIAVHVRFLDFFETVETKRDTYYTRHASDEEKEMMIESMLLTIRNIHEKHEGSDILLFSDSRTFLSVEFPSYVKQLRGKVGHISVYSDDMDVITKTFVDFFVISEASKVYNINGPGTYDSNYCRVAASIGDVPFDRVPRVM